MKNYIDEHQINIAIKDIFADRYSIVKCIGRGGFASVWKAMDHHHSKFCAIKSFYSVASNFYKEALMMYHLQHKNIIKILNIAETSDNLRFLVLEYCEQGSLRDTLNQKNSLSFKQSLQILRQVLVGLVFAHSQGIVHRDLKPENIMLTSEKEQQIVKIADLGLTSFMHQQSTCLSPISGSPSYMAPEQFSNQYSTASDMYAIGIIWYEILCGKTVFFWLSKRVSKASFVYKSKVQ